MRLPDCSGVTPASASARADCGSKQRAASQRAVVSSSKPASVHASAAVAASPPRSASSPNCLMVASPVCGLGSYTFIGYSQNAIEGMPMTVTFFVLVSTAKDSFPPPSFGTLTSVTPNVLSVP